MLSHTPSMNFIQRYGSLYWIGLPCIWLLSNDSRLSWASVSTNNLESLSSMAIFFCRMTRSCDSGFPFLLMDCYDGGIFAIGSAQSGPTFVADLPCYRNEIILVALFALTQSLTLILTWICLDRQIYGIVVSVPILPVPLAHVDGLICCVFSKGWSFTWNHCTCPSIVTLLNIKLGSSVSGVDVPSQSCSQDRFIKSSVWWSACIVMHFTLANSIIATQDCPYPRSACLVSIVRCTHWDS